VGSMSPPAWQETVEVVEFVSEKAGRR